MEAPSISKRITVTDAPVIAFTRRIMSLHHDPMSLGQGVVFWPPPKESLEAVAACLYDPSTSCYGPNEGMPELRKALQEKVANDNGLPGYNVMITHGGNQAFMNLVLSLVDEGDQVVLFKPAYFDHIMSIQMTGGSRTLLYGDTDPVTLKPSIPWLRRALLGEGEGAGGAPQEGRTGKVKMVAIINPNNPTGVLLTRSELQEISDICAAAGAWLVCDNTYEAFSSFDNLLGLQSEAEAEGSAAPSSNGNGTTSPLALASEPPGHHCISGPHVVHVFSFSKAYGLMGWRVGYIAYPDPQHDGGVLGGQLLKTQDTMCICACQASQHAALAALRHGAAYVQQRVAELEDSRRVVLEALSVLGPGSVAGGYSIFFWARLPKGCEDDVKVVEWLVTHFGICVVPGSSCAGPGCIRVSFGSVRGDALTKAAARLKAGLSHLVQHGMQAAPAGAVGPAAAAQS